MSRGGKSLTCGGSSPPDQQILPTVERRKLQVRRTQGYSSSMSREGKSLTCGGSSSSSSSRKLQVRRTQGQTKTALGISTADSVPLSQYFGSLIAARSQYRKNARLPAIDVVLQSIDSGRSATESASNSVPFDQFLRMQKKDVERICFRRRTVDSAGNSEYTKKDGFADSSSRDIASCSRSSARVKSVRFRDESGEVEQAGSLGRVMNERSKSSSPINLGQVAECSKRQVADKLNVDVKLYEL